MAPAVENDASPPPPPPAHSPQTGPPAPRLGPSAAETNTHVDCRFVADGRLSCFSASFVFFLVFGKGWTLFNAKGRWTNLSTHGWTKVDKFVHRWTNVDKFVHPPKCLLWSILVLVENQTESSRMNQIADAPASTICVHA